MASPPNETARSRRGEITGRDKGETVSKNDCTTNRRDSGGIRRKEETKTRSARRASEERKRGALFSRKHVEGGTGGNNKQKSTEATNVDFGSEAKRSVRAVVQREMNDRYGPKPAEHLLQ
jgi:hypothetical protein